MATAHKPRLDAWREMWGQYRAVLDAFDGLIYLCSPSYEIEFVNQHSDITKILGYSPLGQKCHQAFFDLDHQCQKCSKKKVLQGDPTRQIFTHPRTGQTFYQVARPFFQNRDPLMMITVLHLPIDCLNQTISTEPGRAYENMR